MGLWGVGGGYGLQAHQLWGFSAELDSVCPEGTKCDICKIGKTLILSETVEKP
jgi:hypothetical protein